MTRQARYGQAQETALLTCLQGPVLGWLNVIEAHQ